MAMISDIADYDTMRTSQVRTGTYFAFRALISTTTFALGNSIAFYALSAVGYDPARSTNPPGATTGMLLVLTLLPAACNLGAGLLLLRYPITQNRHRAIRRRLDRDPAVALASRVAASRAAV
jgi:Na+/melibiose symporter-like transporter